MTQHGTLLDAHGASGNNRGSYSLGVILCPQSVMWTPGRFADLLDALKTSGGRDLATLDERFLQRCVERRMEESDVATPEEYCQVLLGSPPEANCLHRSLDIHFSTLFRDPLTFAMLEQRVLPILLAQRSRSHRREIRIWSAGCAEGQEAYSLAILLKEMSVGAQREIPFRIFATDNSVAQIQIAAQGVFPLAAMENVRFGHLEKWFNKQGQSYAADKQLRDVIDFSVYDLLDTSTMVPPASIFGEFDLIMCCNVIYYYRHEFQTQILRKLRRALAPEGFLATGEAEGDSVRGARFLPMAPSVCLFQKPR